MSDKFVDYWCACGDWACYEPETGQVTHVFGDDCGLRMGDDFLRAAAREQAEANRRAAARELERTEEAVAQAQWRAVALLARAQQLKTWLEEWSRGEGR